MTTALFTHPDCDLHVTPQGHPERVDRLKAVRRALDGWALERRECPLGTDEDVLLAHRSEYLDLIKQSSPEKGWRQLDADTHMSPGSFTAAMRAVGGVIAAVDAVLAGEVTNAFVAVRPPGHHALKTSAMGFCLFGSVAIAAKHALERRGLSRVAIVDFDVHHGNGTEDLLWDEARVRFVSTHQMPLWPGSGRAEDKGEHGHIMNRALRPGSDGAAMRALYEREVLPWLHDYKPELVLVSAGFDAHLADPLAQLEWEAEDYRWLTERICEVSPHVVSALEGGYDLAALGESVAAHVKVLTEQE
jgi:acetoin utilization deacetylase AcuC-like enzyme